jgi:ribonuclease VapC
VTTGERESILGIVLTARIGLAGKSLLARLLEECGVEVVDLRREHWTVAVDAFVRYGKGRHPAALDFGDCLTYAVPRVAGSRCSASTSTSRGRTPRSSR